MSQPIHVSVPCLCSGRITSHIVKGDTYEVSIYDSPVNELNGPIYCSLIYPPGNRGNYKRGDNVKVLLHFIYDGTTSRFVDVDTKFSGSILGVFDSKSLVEGRANNDMADVDSEQIGLIHADGGSGFTTSERNQATMFSGSIYHILKSFGFGVNKNCSRSMAQNYHRVISHNAPFYLCREHFGMYSGDSLDEESSKTSEEDYSFIFRRFVSQTKNPENFTSVCEGTYDPWLGPNNDNNKVTKSKEILYSRIVNHGTNRVTINMGEPGDSFVNIRVDEVKSNEKSVPTGKGVVSGVLGNKCNITINENGDVAVYAGGSGAGTYKFGMKIKDGDLTIYSSGKIALSHGDNDESINSIVLDPGKGVDIVAKNGFRVNGTELATKAFVDWVDQNKTSFCQSPPGVAGGPAPIFPAATATLAIGVANTMDLGGFTTTGVGSPASGTIKKEDGYTTV